MDSAGKPLRINLSKRLGIGKLTDDTPPLHRHFEAALPDNQQVISEPIPCTRVTIGAYTVEKVLRNIPGVRDVTSRPRLDGYLDAYISVAPKSKLVVGDIIPLISVLIPGYAIPKHMYIILGPLALDHTGNYDYEGMERESLDNEAIDMDKRQLLVRNIFGDVLDAELTHMRKDSDFFLLGGNSLLLGKLSHHIRRQAGVNIGIADLFSNSTIQGIATLIEENDGSDESEYHCTDQDTKKTAATTANSSFTTVSIDYDFEHDPEYASKRRGRSQDHPLCLVVQAIPFFVFYPLKAALTCASIHLSVNSYFIVGNTTGSWMLVTLSHLSGLTEASFWRRMIAMFVAILSARVIAGIICPVTAIAFKWIIIGRYQPGTHQM
jgi:aryl carrier-like protein